MPTWPSTATWSSWAHREPARPTWPPHWAPPLAGRGTGSCSPPPPIGSHDWARHTSRGRLAPELTRLRRYELIIIDEVGYLPFEQDAANLFFQLVSSRYEHASLILTSNLPFSSWAGVFGDQVVAAAMIDRIVHHADVIALKGASYRLRDRGVDTLPSIKAEQESLD